jgi:hypothetical protein
VTKLSERAAAVAARVGDEDGTTKFSIALVVTIIGVIINAVKLWQSCKTAAGTPRSAARRPLFRVRTQRSARRELQAQGLDVGLADRVAAESLAEIESMTDDDVAAVVAEVETGVLK